MNSAAWRKPPPSPAAMGDRHAGLPGIRSRAGASRSFPPVAREQAIPKRLRLELPDRQRGRRERIERLRPGRHQPALEAAGEAKAHAALPGEGDGARPHDLARLTGSSANERARCCCHESGDNLRPAKQRREGAMSWFQGRSTGVRRRAAASPGAAAGRRLLRRRGAAAALGAVPPCISRASVTRRSPRR